MKNIFIFLLILVLSSCGGGSDGGDSPDPQNTNNSSTTQTESIDADDVFFQRTNETLSGSFNDDTPLTGTISTSVGSQETFEGVLTTPVNSLVTLSDGTTTISASSTSYYASDRSIVGYYSVSADRTCIANTLDVVADILRSGDFGTGSNLRCDDGYSISYNWRVESNGNNLDFVTTTKIRDQFDAVFATGTATQTINSSGNIISFQASENIEGDIYEYGF